MARSARRYMSGPVASGRAPPASHGLLQRAAAAKMPMTASSEIEPTRRLECGGRGSTFSSRGRALGRRDEPGLVWTDQENLGTAAEAVGSVNNPRAAWWIRSARHCPSALAARRPEARQAVDAVRSQVGPDEPVEAVLRRWLAVMRMPSLPGAAQPRATPGLFWSLSLWSGTGAPRPDHSRATPATSRRCIGPGRGRTWTVASPRRCRLGTDRRPRATPLFSRTWRTRRG